VVEFNIPAAPERYAAVAEALGVPSKGDAVATAHEGVAALRRLALESGIPMRLRDWNIPESSIDEMADSAMEVTRLLKNNLREVTREDAVRIYRAAY
jgi:alcohol dehydrogenase class IV